MTLARLRRSKGFSQKTLAQKAGVSPSTIWEIEAGRHSPNPSTLLKLAVGLGVSTEEVLEAVETPKAEAPYPSIKETVRRLSDMSAAMGMEIEAVTRATGSVPKELLDEVERTTRNLEEVLRRVQEVGKKQSSLRDNAAVEN